MIEQEQEIDIKKINKKINTLSTTKKIALIGCLFAILGALYYMTTIDVIQTFEYKQNDIVLCKEVYVNGVLNTTPCPQNTNYFPIQNNFTALQLEEINKKLYQK